MLAPAYRVEPYVYRQCLSSEVTHRPEILLREQDAYSPVALHRVGEVRLQASEPDAMRRRRATVGSRMGDRAVGLLRRKLTPTVLSCWHT